ncbi:MULTISPECIES: TetR/AcrR family transcriptional regulator [Rhodomicrobium]|uniref:TetR/AcrR family transcriptional regulator n=1 Tax=Rhodomicrobium TaxID=1068 RepID=UPI000B4BA143|nr:MULTISPECIES: TetR/AcrR family transcriptional regulator [Rhodomicrobium]
MKTERARKLAAPATPPPQKQKRLSPGERKRDFIQKAAELFAEEGFGGGTRELANKLGVTQPLLYRYFPSKEELIEEVYRSVFLDRWDPEWDALLADRAVPIRERLERFYCSYTDAIFTRQWLRIYLFAGLKGLDLNSRYIEFVQERILTRIIVEYRHEAGLPPQEKPAAAEMELAWFLQGGIFYYGVRKHLYGLEVLEDKDRVIANALDVFLEGISRLFATSVRMRSAYGRRSVVRDEGAA